MFDTIRVHGIPGSPYVRQPLLDALQAMKQ